MPSVLAQLVRDLRAQKMRTLLTTFGIVWGTCAVSLLLAFGQGMHRQMRINSAGLGENIVIAWPSRTSIPFEGLGKGRRIRVDEEGIELVRAKAENLLGISSEYSRDLKLNYAEKTLSVQVSGVLPEFAELRNLIPQAGGRFLNARDEASQRRVVFLGNELARDVFGEADPVGRTIRLHGSPFLVVGVLKAKNQDSSYQGRDKDMGWVPGSTFRALTGQKYVSNFIFKAVSGEANLPLQKQVLEILAGRYRFHPEDKEALGLWDTTEMFQFLDTFMLGFRAFLGIVGSLTLVVGGIGVSNIMNVVVEERTREIGIKMALGAKPSWILSQFLLETLVITIVGGAAGIALTYGICQVFPASAAEFVGIPVISPFVAALTAALLGVVGIVAGWFPAREASRLDPIVAMKM